MRHYDARLRLATGFWDWTVERRGVVVPTGACASGKCEHQTRAEAEAHETERLRSRFADVQRESLPNHTCSVPGCGKAAVVALCLEGSHYILCEKHNEDPSWVAARPSFRS